MHYLLASFNSLLYNSKNILKPNHLLAHMLRVTDGDL